VPVPVPPGTTVSFIPSSRSCTVAAAAAACSPGLCFELCSGSLPLRPLTPPPSPSHPALEDICFCLCNCKCLNAPGRANPTLPFYPAPPQSARLDRWDLLSGTAPIEKSNQAPRLLWCTLRIASWSPKRLPLLPAVSTIESQPPTQRRTQASLEDTFDRHTRQYLLWPLANRTDTLVRSGCAGLTQKHWDLDETAVERAPFAARDITTTCRGRLRIEAPVL
jgi:hypothetical protein